MLDEANYRRWGGSPVGNELSKVAESVIVWGGKDEGAQRYGTGTRPDEARKRNKKMRE